MLVSHNTHGIFVLERAPIVQINVNGHINLLEKWRNDYGTQPSVVKDAPHAHRKPKGCAARALDRSANPTLGRSAVRTSSFGSFAAPSFPNEKNPDNHGQKTKQNDVPSLMFDRIPND